MYRTLAMPYEIRLDAPRGLVVVTLEGALHAKDVAEAVMKAREQAVEHDYDLLYDMREAKLGDISMSDLFFMPRRLDVLKTSTAGQHRVAVAYPLGQEKFARFWETTFANSGLQARAFTELEAAYRWLAAGREG